MFQSWPYQQETYFLASARLAFGKTSNLRVSQLDTLHELVLAGLIYQRMRKTATRWKASCPQCGSAKVDTPLQAFALKQDLIRPAPSFRPRMETQQMQIPFMQSDFGGNGNDWQCPNTECINNTKMVFGKHSSCPSCGTARS
ncbi:unnamed protein product [Effrenium voratum]|nr:unnamed protein product [Effrenium voratum]